MSEANNLLVYADGDNFCQKKQKFRKEINLVTNAEQSHNIQKTKKCPIHLTHIQRLKLLKNRSEIRRCRRGSTTESSSPTFVAFTRVIYYLIVLRFQGHQYRVKCKVTVKGILFEKVTQPSCCDLLLLLLLYYIYCHYFAALSSLVSYKRKHILGSFSGPLEYFRLNTVGVCRNTFT